MRGMPKHLIAAVLVLLSLLSGVAQGQVVRAFTPRYTTTTKGALELIGNTLMTCSSSVSTCAMRQANKGYNNSVLMDYVNVDPGAGLTNSSSATLSLPSGATVLWAGLYWGARVDSSTPDATKRTVRFKPPGAAAYSAISASQLDKTTRTINTIDYDFYQGFADVTALVSASGSGTYWVGGVAAATGQDGTGFYAGWSLLVVYQQSALPKRNLTIFDGFATVSNGNDVDITVSGFLTPAVGSFSSSLGAVVYEGDGGIRGDSLQVNGRAISDGLNAADNFFDSSISRLGARVGAKTPNYLNQLGFDVDQVDITGRLPNGATSANLRFTSTQDLYFPGVLGFVTEIFEPDLTSTFTKTVIDTNGGRLEPGDVLEYTLAFTNTGNDGAINVVLTDPIPAHTTYMPGSLVVVSGANAGAKSDGAGDDQAEYDALANLVRFRLGTGANASTGGLILPTQGTTLRFRVQVDPDVPGGVAITNQATLTYNGQTLGTAVSQSASAQANATVVPPDLSLAKSHADPFTRGSKGTYTLEISNVGAGVARGTVTVTDTVPTGLVPVGASGAGWSCALAAQTVSCTRADDLAAGASYPPITLEVGVEQSAPSAITNTATVSHALDPNPDNDTAADPTTIIDGGSVSGTIYEDLEPNGLRDEGETWANGSPVFVNLVQNGTVVHSAQVLPGSGTYGLGGVAPGSYTLLVAVTADATTPAAPPGWLFVGPGSRSLNVGSGEVTGQDFGLFHGSKVTGTVFRDDGQGGGVANDARRQAGEAGVAGVIISASDGVNVRSAPTDALGVYTIYLPYAWASPVVLAHPLTPATGTSIGGSSVELATGYADVGAARRSIVTVSGVVYDGYDFGVVGSSALDPDHAGQTTSPGVITYRHLYRPGTLGTVTLQQSGGIYPYQARRDVNCDGDVDDAGEGEQPLPFSFAVTDAWPRAADGSFASCAIELQVTVPAGEVVGATDVASVSATLVWATNTSVRDVRTVRDATTVVAQGGLQLEKRVRNVTQGGGFARQASGAPGERLEYCVSYQNVGVEVLADVALTDPLPFFTDFVAEAYGSGRDIRWTRHDDGALQYLSAAPGDDEGTLAGDVLSLSGGAMAQVAPGERGELCFQVEIR